MATKYNPFLQETLILECSQSNDVPFIWSSSTDYTGYTPTINIYTKSGSLLYTVTTVANTNGDIIVWTANPALLEFRMSLTTRNELTVGTMYRFICQLTKATFPTIPIAFVADLEVIL
jgi:hypothetical protein